MTWLMYVQSNELQAIMVEEESIVEIEEIIFPTSKQKLIPQNAVLGVDDVKQVEFLYTVSMKKKKNDAKLHVDVLEILVDGKTECAHLVNLEITMEENNQTDIMYVRVVVTLNMPKNENERNMLQFKNIRYRLGFQMSKLNLNEMNIE